MRVGDVAACEAFGLSETNHDLKSINGLSPVFGVEYSSEAGLFPQVAATRSSSKSASKRGFMRTYSSENDETKWLKTIGVVLDTVTDG